LEFLGNKPPFAGLFFFDVIAGSKPKLRKEGFQEGSLAEESNDQISMTAEQILISSSYA